MKRLFPVIFLASFAVFAEEVDPKGQPTSEHFAGVQINKAPTKDDAGTILNGIIDHLSQALNLARKAYNSSGLSKYVAFEPAMVGIGAVLSFVGYKFRQRRIQKNAGSEPCTSCAGSAPKTDMPTTDTPTAAPAEVPEPASDKKND